MSRASAEPVTGPTARSSRTSRDEPGAHAGIGRTARTAPRKARIRRPAGPTVRVRATRTRDLAAGPPFSGRRRVRTRSGGRSTAAPLPSPREITRVCRRSRQPRRPHPSPAPPPSAAAEATGRADAQASRPRGPHRAGAGPDRLHGGCAAEFGGQPLPSDSSRRKACGVKHRSASVSVTAPSRTAAISRNTPARQGCAPTSPSAA